MTKGSPPSKPLPLFEYAKEYEDFASYEDFDHYFVHCLQTSGFKKHIIAQWMDLSDVALSIRLNLVDQDQPRFNTKQIGKYVKNCGDNRPAQYLEWQAKTARVSDEEILKEKMSKLIPHIDAIRMFCDLLEGKK